MLTICHKDKTGKRGENVMGTSVFLIVIVLVFGGETLHYSIVMMSIIYVLMMSWIFLKTINKHVLNSSVHNTSRFQ